MGGGQLRRSEACKQSGDGEGYDGPGKHYKVSQRIKGWQSNQDFKGIFTCAAAGPSLVVLEYRSQLVIFIRSTLYQNGSMLGHCDLKSS